MGYYPPTYLIPKYFSDKGIKWYKRHLGFLNFDDDSNFLAECKTESDEVDVDYKNKPSIPSSGTNFVYTPLYNQWRYLLNSDLDLTTRKNAIQKVPGLSGNAIKLITVDSGSSTITNTTPLLDFNSRIDWSWWFNIYTEFDIQTPDHDSIVFQAGLFSPSNESTVEEFYNKNNSEFRLYSLTIYFKNNKYYCMITRTNNDNTSVQGSSAFVDESLISTMSDSNEIVGSWNHISLLHEPYNTLNPGFVVIFNNKVCFKLKSGFDINGAGWCPTTVKYSYNLSSHEKIIYGRIDIDSSGTEQETILRDTVQCNAHDQPIMYFGSGISSYIKSLGINSSSTKNSVSKNINIVDYTTDPGMDQVEFVKDPISKGILNLSFNHNIGDSLVYDNIEMFKIKSMYALTRDLNTSIIVPDDIQFDQNLFSIDIDAAQDITPVDIVPVTISVKEDIEQDILNPISVDAAKDIDPVDIPSSIDVSEDLVQDLLNPIEVTIGKDITPVDPFEITVEATNPFKPIEEIEEYINKTYLGTQQAAEDFQLLYKVTEYSYWPVDFSIDNNYHIHIKKSEVYLGATLYACTNKQFLYGKYVI